MDKQQYHLGDIVRMKKQHPCGSSEWEILRVGMDFRLKCQGCGHLVMLPGLNLKKWSGLSSAAQTKNSKCHLKYIINSLLQEKEWLFVSRVAMKRLVKGCFYMYIE